MNSNAKLRWGDLYPELGIEPIPTEPCISPEIYQEEIEKVFSKVWLKVGRVEEIPKQGDYKVKRLDFAKTSVILMHGKDGEIRGFHNICSHRGNKVVVETGNETFGSNKAAVVTCRFHGWVYDAKGDLVSVPEEEKFTSCFDKGHNGLAPIRTEVWEGFIFINLDNDGTQSVEEFLGGMGQHLGGYPFHEMEECFAYNTVLNCNWKVAHDAFAEAYHVATIHAGSFPNVFASGLQEVQLFGDHRTCAVCLTKNANPKPAAALSGEITGASLVNHYERVQLPKSVNPNDRDDFSFELSVIFPNILVHVTEGVWFTHQFWPVGHNQTRWEGRYYLPKAKTYSERWAQEFAQVLQRNAWLEDTATMEDTQEALESRAKKVMHLQDEEILIRHGYHVLEQYLNRA
ncbi:aromatic ring-hydroxylating oxygenase subunit alpha [Acinetobacter sp. DSM 11652]|uniref:aromatic ring-hydroxylating oxygenase subunit alpha n=1 Tax=Acinetobacter sp. DSM 11652 TaxID=346222 RepID=UPI0008D425C5|nr:aromatic ring-hydroxylating dioxygenase subunit alpha [Acinetobacter sp. DSM 11652]SEL68172.1 Phenylpropionate dioxygenase, large terminal subunit [Acinetobacter sp. DSM 11652]